jgi:hypothetical protein
MGGEKKTETTTVVQSGQTTPQATPEQQELDRILLGQARAADPLQREVTQAGLSRTLELFRGEELPGFFGDIGRGISPEITEELSQEAVQDLLPSFQTSGILDSGVAASVAGRVAGDIRRGVAEFNIGNKLNLLNLALGGQAQIQQPLLQGTNILGANLRSLIGTSFTGTRTGTATSRGPNPFLNAFQTSLGQTLGSPSFTTGGFTF